MPPDKLQRAGELLENDGLGLHAVTKIKALIGHGDRCGDGGTVVPRQDGFEDRRANRVPAPPNHERNSEAYNRTLDVPSSAADVWHKLGMTEMRGGANLGVASAVNS